ncbi:MAG: hypothetical protein HRT47_01610 [Candidatus Caenarcaniphilales bacterium]|nr:hypothetical protein [Candidatus Caenarcaniphilales bacterium]
MIRGLKNLGIFLLAIIVMIVCGFIISLGMMFTSWALVNLGWNIDLEYLEKATEGTYMLGILAFIIFMAGVMIGGASSD